MMLLSLLQVSRGKQNGVGVFVYELLSIDEAFALLGVVGEATSKCRSCQGTK